MPTDTLTVWSAASAVIAEQLGLHFPPERLPELRRGLGLAANELGLADADACAQRLLAAQLTESEMEVVASHLTIGETYFLRCPDTFSALATQVLPALVAARRRNGKRLRIWSAACCSGEEAYSLAIVLRQLLPDVDDWDISILATDINPRFLHKAAEGIYGDWSFRSAPDGFRERYFHRTTGGRYALKDDYKRLVTFAPLNLVDPDFPSRLPGMRAMDLILCRNVLMYFTPEQAARVVDQLHQSLAQDGWLVVAACEVSQTLFSRFSARALDGAILYQKGAPATPVSSPACTTTAWTSPPPPAVTGTPKLAPVTTTATPLAELARVELARAALSEASAPPRASSLDANSMATLAHALANQGRLSDALARCDRWIALDKLDADAHYLRAMVLLECRELVEARTALQRCAYLQPDTAMVSFSLANVERGLGRHTEAMHHYGRTLSLLEREPRHAEVRYSEGLTAAQLTALVRDLLVAERAA